ncbi:glycosyltransferase family 4 protein [Streptoalloteichus hindustanus]|uniref:Glycosyltransferase involved in cell wall bisynthesis n=1 Tax=Streptoalloteichus hindustanus TaxID=2017 RepID=A0A1M4YYZ6_STRHI|nr:Glycosyltransferase involved in cell wall bisynthesis [Streptoalloteichus hindustanus]
MSGQPLHIAMVATPWFTLPPHAYGGIEQMVANLVEVLVADGHELTLIGVGDNGTNAQHFLTTYGQPECDRLGAAIPEVVHAGQAARLLAELRVDLVHDHSLAGPLTAAGREIPTAVTVHLPVNGELGDLYAALGDSVRLVAISEAQRESRPELNWIGMVHNAVRVDTYPYSDDKEDYALFLGRASWQKGLHVAVDAAREADVPLVVAAKCIEESEKIYFDEEVKPRLGPGVEWIGQVDAVGKRKLLQHARCLVFPILGDEAFGLVMVEALACGTPVVALRRASVAEIVRSGETGLVCDTPEELPNALHEVRRISPARCREDARLRFDSVGMAHRYEDLYRRVLSGEAEATREAH